jgi:hypothetical protein
MKVWELMAFLAKQPAGASVLVTDTPDGTYNDLAACSDDGDDIRLCGDGRWTEVEKRHDDAA